MVRHFFRADITTAPMAPRINYPGDWYENAEKIIVAAYDDANHACYALTDDDKLFSDLMATHRIVEITEVEFSSEVSRLRPPPADVQIVVNPTAKTKDSSIVTDLRSFLDSKASLTNLTYRLEET